MNSKIVGTVYRKEMLEVLRDKRTLFTTLILPLILYPLLMVGFNTLMMRQTKVMEEKGATVAVRDSINNEVSQLLTAGLKNIEKYTIVPWSNTTDKLYADKDIQAVLTLRDSLGDDGSRFYKIYIQHDKSKEQGRMVFNKLSDSIAKTGKTIQKQQLAQNGLNPEFLDLVSVRSRDTSTAEKKMGMILGMILPYIMILMLLTGASTAAADLVAGEKERKTLETLLVSAAGRVELVFGKYLTIITLGLINVIVNLFSISLSMKFMLSNATSEMANTQLPLNAIFILILAMVPLATLFAAILLSISTFSRNMKEARSYEQPLMIVAMLLSMVSFLPAVEMNNLMALVPVINIALLFKAVMINEYTLMQLLLTIGSTLILDVLAIWGTIKLFTTESVLFRSEDDGGGLKSVKKNKSGFFNPYNGIVYFSLALVVLYYLGSYMQMKDLMRGLINTQVFIIALPVLLILRILKLNPKQILRLKMPGKEIFVIPFIAIPMALIVSLLMQFVDMLFPFPSEYLEQLGKLFTMDTSTWKMLLVMAVLPGLCEELLFRGFMIRFFEKYGYKQATIISALLFAAFHLDPIRFFPVFLLGMVLGYLTLHSGSIYNAMLSHAINNGLAFVITTYAASPFIKPLLTSSKQGGEQSLSYWILIPALLILAGGLYLFNKITAKGFEKCVESSAI